MFIKLLFYSVVLCIAFFGYQHYAHPSSTQKIGDPAPDFSLNDTHGRLHTLADYAGQYLILYFYPKDDTPVCTKEACHFRDDFLQFEKLGAKVVGISVDTTASHQQFAEKYHLPFTLLTDTSGAVANSYHSLTDLYFIKAAKRHTFLIGPTGTIEKLYTNVDATNHSQQIIGDLKSLKQISAH